MEPRVSLVTLGVTDLHRARRFYEALGWAGQVVQDTAFFQAGPMALVLWSRVSLAADSGVADSGPVEFGGVVLAHNVRTPADVDDIVALAARHGARITREPAPTFYGGYAGCFADPDGHLWEVAHNPGFGLDDDAALVLPDFPTPPDG